MAKIGKDLNKAVEILRQSGLVAIPTETVYGLAGNALDTEAITQIFKVKNRPSFDPLIVHTDQIEKVKPFTKEIPKKALRLAEHYWPGPLTLLLQKKEIIPDLVTSGLSTVAVRIPSHPLTLSLLKALDFPLAAPSANPFGYVSPTTAFHVEHQLGTKIPYILDGGACEIGIESTIVGFSGKETVIYRLGGKKIEDIEKTAGRIRLLPHSSSRPKAPGNLKNHYSPQKEIILGDLSRLIDHYKKENIAVLSFQNYHTQINREKQFILSSKGDMAEAAKNLFAMLRRLDALPIDKILAELVPEYGLGLAINDRLRRAAAG